LLLIAGLVPLSSINAGSKKIIKPIRRLMHAVEGVASGNFDQITNIHTGDEIEALAEQFNVMAAKLRESYGSLERKVAARTHELETLNAVAAVVSRSLDLDETLAAALDSVLTRLNMDAGCIHTVNTVDNTLDLRVHQGLSEVFATAAQHIAVGEGLIGQTITQKQLIIVAVSEYDNDRLAALIQEADIQTLVSTPIMSKGEILGVLTLATQQERAFLAEEQTLIAAIGQQLSVGIENSRLYTQAQQELSERKRAQERLRWVSEERARHNRELLLLNRVIAATTSQLDADAVLEAVCRELALVFDIPQAGAALLNNARTALTVVAEYQSRPDLATGVGTIIPLEDNSATQYVLETKNQLMILEAQHDPRTAAIHDLMKQRGVASLLILPLLIRGEVVGTIGLDSHIHREFSQAELDLAATATATAAQALEKARAEEKLRESEARYRDLFNQSPVGIFRTTMDGVIVDANPTLMQLLDFDSLDAGNKVGLTNLYADPADRLE
jgi:GAF domain-containing protein/HAMP domain-containing protein